jgi:hypothetical protein
VLLFQNQLSLTELRNQVSVDGIQARVLLVVLLPARSWYSPDHSISLNYSLNPPLCASLEYRPQGSHRRYMCKNPEALGK